MAEISKITLPSGSTYDLKDAVARASISEIEAAISGGLTFRGVTTTPLADDATTSPIIINGESVEVRNGYLVVYGKKEFLFADGKWIEAGDLSLIGALGYKDEATGDFTPAGTNSAPAFSGQEMTATGKFTPDGSVAISVGSGDANYTPSGTVTQPTFSGDVLTSTGTLTPRGSVAVSVGNGETNFTPAGTISKPDVEVTPTTDNVYSITDVGSLPALSTSVENEVLTFSFDAGSLPTKGEAQAVMTGASAALVNAPTFTGTAVDLEAAFTGVEENVSVTGTPAGTVSQPTFTGTGVNLDASFTGVEGTVTAKGTPEGSVEAPVFTGTTGTVTVS